MNHLGKASPLLAQVMDGTFFPAQFFGDKNHTGFLDFPTDFPFFSHGLSRKAERGVERTASGEEEKLHPTGKKKAIPTGGKKGAVILLIKARPLQTKAEKGHELERKSSRSLKPKQGLVNVPFWEYWTSPYSSHYRPYT